jgi:hypothetical protein
MDFVGIWSCLNFMGITCETLARELGRSDSYQQWESSRLLLYFYTEFTYCSEGSCFASCLLFLFSSDKTERAIWYRIVFLLQAQSLENYIKNVFFPTGNICKSDCNFIIFPMSRSLVSGFQKSL